MGQPIPDTMHRGHIPGAINLARADMLDKDSNCFHQPVHIKEGKCSIFWPVSQSQWYIHMNS